MKTHVLIVSEYFPKTHYRSGEKTYFVDSIKEGTKIHTIRGNYELWKKRITEVENGDAILSVRIWTGKPYNSKQEEVFQFNQDSGIGVQKMMIRNDKWNNPFIIKDCHLRSLDLSYLSKNDGLELEDFKKWFKKSEPYEVMAIIHFTLFRY
jgi:hypothetical protein